MKKFKSLPDKPSELLMVAMEDLEKIETMEKIKINMSSWVDNCEVCHAGAVMINSLGVDAEKCWAPFQLSSPDLKGKRSASEKLNAINDIREGNIFGFFECLGIENPWINEDDDEEIDFCGRDENGFSPSYYSERKYDSEEDWNTYKNWIVSFIGILQAEGL
jgi:hypothetical protein